MKRLLRWDEARACKLCRDLGTYLYEVDGGWIEAVCTCEAGDEAHGLRSDALDGVRA